ncbi:MAG TPA: hypothetical protein VG815_17165, partial [Chloroflexota bacterium]|nr:hypothetical protein [Chloroflexota bacterium]
MGWGRIVSEAFVFVYSHGFGGVFELALFGFAAVSLDLAELSESPLELAGETLAVDADLGEGAGVLTEGHCHGEGGFGLRMAGVDAVFHFGDAEREEVGLDGGGAVHAPGGIDERLDELGLDSAFRLAFIEQGLGVALVGGVVLGGQDDGLARETVAQRVERGALFT